MTSGERDSVGAADEPSRHPLLSPEDRVWRHPAEVAMLARQARRDRRRRRLKLSATLVSGATAALVLTWLSQSDRPATLTADSAMISADDTTADDTALDDTALDDTALDNTALDDTALDENAPATTTSLLEQALAELFPVADITVHESDSSAAMAAGFMVREGYLISSGLAIGAAREVTVRWGDMSIVGEVVGYDEATDISVIRVADGLPHDDLAEADAVAPGDRITLAPPSDDQSHLTVVKPVATANVDGDPMMGVVELDGNLGEILPGSPAYDAEGALVGVAAATEDDAPMALMPISVARSIAYEIIDTGAATHARLGIRARTVMADDDPTTAVGSLVTAVDVEGPAAIGGMAEGDVIVEIAGNAIDSAESMVRALHDHEPGDEVAVIVDRDGELVECAVELDSAVPVDS